MDRYELNVKMEQIKKLARQKEYAAASKIADTIDFYKIKENKNLQLLADVYEASGRYSQAKDVLIEAYARTTLGRQFAYRLVKLCIKSGNISEAEDFYDDFINAAPKDNSKYILQYELATAKGQPLEERIKILETYLSDDMDEKWAFELAKLYHKSGQKDKCIRQCDDVILWFNDGKYADKAMELKMLYAPLTKSQQAKYEERWMAKSRANVNVDDIKVKEYDAANKYNTVNIQNALKESMDVIMNEEDMYAKPSKEREKQEDLEKTKVVFTDEVVNSLLSHTVRDISLPEKYNTVPLSPVLDMDSDGQLEMNIEDEPVDDQIEGQMTIGDLLDMYEKREAEEVLTEAAVTEETEETEESINNAEDDKEISEDNPETPDMEMIDEDETEESHEDSTEDELFSDDLLDDEISERLAGEEQDEPQVDLEEKLMDVTVDISDVQIALAKISGALDESYDEGKNEEQQEAADHKSILEETEEDIEEFDEEVEDDVNEFAEEAENTATEFNEETEDTANESDEEMKEITEEEEKPQSAESDKTEAAEDSQEPEETFDEAQKEDAQKEEADIKKEKADNTNPQPAKQIGNNEVKELIKDFVTKYSGVQGLDRQLLAVLQAVLINHNTRLIVMGEVKSGKTALAIDLVKIINKIQQIRGRKIAKINGDVLNEGNVSEYFEKLAGMDIIIERAGSLNNTVAAKIIEETENDPDYRILVLEDEKSNMEEFLKNNEQADKLFKGRLVVRQNKIRDWALVAKKYAEAQGYEIDEMGILALHARIDDLYAISLLIGKNQVEEIIDNAIKKSKSKRFGKVLKLFGKEREKILREEDF